MIGAWQASGLSVRTYAQQAGINERRLSLWHRRLATPEEATPAGSHFGDFINGYEFITANGGGVAILNFGSSGRRIFLAR